jgi:SAM-dependent methyltransferase
MYHSGADEGGSAVFWEKAWSDGAFQEALRFCEVDPLGPLLRHHLRPGRRVLEGGCGRGQYVAYYSARGARVVGLDFARDALSELRRRDADLLLCAGDVGALPFRSASFDVYYSGGVVEHFESGPQAALREARRVLRDDGVLLVSVPYLSPVRKMLAPLRRGDRRVVPKAALDGDQRRGTFYQYAFTRREFARILGDCGLRVEAVQEYAILWGLGEVPGVGRLLERASRSRAAAPATTGPEAPPGHPEAPPGAKPTAGAPPSWLKRLAVSEDAGVPILGRMVPLLRWACANMILFVCVPDGAAPAGAK